MSKRPFNAYKNGEKHGRWFYFKDDTDWLQKRCTYKDGKLDGLCSESYENGRDRKTTDYKNGFPHGRCSEYYENGRLRESSAYKNGEKHGLCWEGYECGSVRKRYTYAQGELHGAFEEYLPKSLGGEIANKGYYNMGEKCGEWIEDGQPVTYDSCPPDLEGGN